jgi:hypothetical protein
MDDVRVKTLDRKKAGGYANYWLTLILIVTAIAFGIWLYGYVVQQTIAYLSTLGLFDTTLDYGDSLVFGLCLAFLASVLGSLARGPK